MVAVDTGNGLLVNTPTDDDDDDDDADDAGGVGGIAVDLAAALATRLGAPLVRT